MNRVTLLGRLCADPEVRTTATSKVATLRIATNRVYYDRDRKKQEQTEYHSCVLWGDRVDSMVPHLHKGDPLALIGELRTREYLKKVNLGRDTIDVKTYVTEVHINEIEFVPAPPRSRRG